MELINFQIKKREKDWKFERDILRELSITNLRLSVEMTFRTDGPVYILSHFRPLLDTAFDCAVEAYLLGATNSHSLNDSLEKISKQRPQQIEVTATILKQYVEYYFAKYRFPMIQKIFIQCEHLIYFWWLEGYKVGKKRKKLRL